MRNITCPRCGEDQANLTSSGCCWECGYDLHQISVPAPVAPRKSDEERISEHDAKQAAEAQKIVPVALKKIATSDVHDAISVIKSTVKAKGATFGRFLVAALREESAAHPDNEKLAHLLRVAGFTY